MLKKLIKHWKKNKEFNSKKDITRLREVIEKIQTQLILTPMDNSLWMQEKDIQEQL